MHQRMPHSRLARTLVLGAVLGIALACPPPALPPSGATTMAGRPECPHDLAERYAKADSTLVVLASGELVVPGWQSNVPEFNDCQRFRMRDVTTGQLVSSRSVGTLGYDSLFAVFAARNLDSVYAAAEASSNRRKGASDENGQLVESDRRGKSGTAAPIIGNTTSMNWTNGIIVGVVLAEGDYPYLGLRRGLNCVLLRRPAAGSYEARVVPVGKRDDVCLNLDSLRSRPSRLLSVRVATAVPAGELPPVARWDWDSAQAKHFIGIKCPAGWCELTDNAPSAPTPVHAVPPGYPSQWTRVVQGRGWHDEQLVAAYEDGPPHRAAISNMWGTVFPHPDLGSYTLANWTRGVWRDVAVIAMRDPDTDYRRKLGVWPQASAIPVLTGAPGRPFTPVIQFCTDSAAATGSSAGGVARCKADISPKLAADCEKSQWFARVQPTPDGKWTYMCVKYRGMPTPQPIPAVARWRWVASDETLWIRCPTGCCEVIVEKK